MHLLRLARTPWLRLALMTLAGTLGTSAQNIYVSDVTGGVTVANGSTGAVVASVPLTGAPAGLALAPGGQSLYVALYAASSVAVVDTALNTVIATITVGTGPLRLAITPDGQTLYVANSASNTVSAISTATNTVLATIPVGPAPTTLAVAPDGAGVFVGDLVSGTVSVIGTASNTVTAIWQTAPGVSALAVSPDGSTLYVASRSANQLAAYDAASGNLLETVLGLKWPDAIAVAPSGNPVYVSSGRGSYVAVLNMAGTAPLGVVATVSVASGPTSVATSPDGSELYVASQSANSVSVINSATYAVASTVPMPAPFAVASGVAAAPTPDLCSAAPTGLPELPASVVLPALPQSCTVPVYPTPTSTVTVNTAAALQEALTNAQCGQRIQVQAGVTYYGGFVVPGLACPASGPVLVENSAILATVTCTATSGPPCSSSTVGQTTQAFPRWAVPSQLLAGTSYVPTLESTDSSSPFFVTDGAANWYFAGIEVTLSPTAYYIYPIVAMGENTATVAALPQNITFDRMLIHPAECPADSISDPCNYVARGIDLNAVNGTLMFSNIWGIVAAGQDTQAVNLNNTTGPGLILGNYLEATGENVMLNTSCTIVPPGYLGSQGFVPGYPGIPTCPAPSDYTVRLNHFHKSLAWQNLPTGCNAALSQCYDVKNDFEVKHGQRVLVDSNWFDTTYAGGQAEFLISNCFDAGIYVCRDLTVTSNVFENGPEVGAVAGNGQPAPSTTCGAAGQPACTIQTGIGFEFRNNLAINISGAFFQFQNTQGAIIDHNTTVNGSQMTNYNALNFSDAQPNTDLTFQYTNNFIFGSAFNDGGGGGVTLAALPSPILGGDVLVGDYWGYPNIWGVVYAPVYPAGVTSLSSSAVSVAGTPPLTCQNENSILPTCWPLDWALVGFTDFTGGSAGTDLPGLALAVTSPYHNAATDGMDIGANIAAVLAAVNGVMQ